MITHQASTHCPQCGSWYRNGDKCNACGVVIVEKEPEQEMFVSHSSAGRQWSKSLHRYLTHAEIAQGKRVGNESIG